MTRRRGVLVVAFVGAVIAALVATVAVVLIEDEVDGPTLLARAREFVEDSRGVHFAGRLTVEFTDPEADETVSTRTRLRGDTDFTNSHVFTEQGEIVSEVLTVGTTVFVREAESQRDLRAEKFGEYDPEQQSRQAGIVAPGEAEDSAQTGEPASLPEILDGAERPRVASSEDGEFVVVADIDEDVLERAGTDGEGSLRLAMRENGRIDRVRIEIDAEDGEVLGDYEFSRWGRPVEVERPPSSQIDPTPNIDEEDLADWDESPLYSPRSIPRGWVLDGAYIVPAEQTVEECDQVAVDYTDPEDPEAGFLSLFEMPSTCDGVDVEPPRGAEPFTAGRFSGWIEEDEDGVYAQILVGETVVQADTDLDPASVAAVLASLAAFDLDAPTTPISTPGTTQSA